MFQSTLCRLSCLQTSLLILDFISSQHQAPCLSFSSGSFESAPLSTRFSGNPRPAISSVFFLGPFWNHHCPFISTFRSASPLPGGFSQSLNPSGVPGPPSSFSTLPNRSTLLSINLLKFIPVLPECVYACGLNSYLKLWPSPSPPA